MKHTNAVWQIQRALRTVSEANEAVSRIVADGIYGSETTQAVREFQEMKDLPITGEVDATTWAVLFACAEDIKYGQKMPEALQIFPYQGTIAEKEAHESVHATQIILNALSEDYANFCSVEQSGTHSRESVEAVQHFQQCALLPPTGVIDTPTWDMLCRWYNVR